MASQQETARKIEFIMTQRVKDRFPRQRIQQATRLVAAIALQEVKDRTNEGIDIDGRPFPKYSKRYPKVKNDFINGRRGKRRGTARDRKTQYAAKNVDDRMRLSGRMFSDMYIRLVRGQNDNGFLGGTFQMDFKSDRSRKIAGYNIKRGYNFWGLSRPSSARGRLLVAKMKSAFKGALGFRGGGNLSIDTGA
jgi:hypothetical protein